MGAEVGRGENSLDLDHAVSSRPTFVAPSAQRSPRTKLWNRWRSSRVIAPGRPEPRCAAVTFDDGDQLGGGAGQETLVGSVDVVPVHRPLEHRIARGSSPARSPRRE